ncbi:hypothetical protein MBLNU230_g5536t1 [Neophaeotheca triangularis]
MRHSSWRNAPLLLVTFLFFLASSYAHEEIVLEDAQQPKQEVFGVDELSTDNVHANGQHDRKTSEAVNEASDLLRKIKPPTTSKLVQYTAKPKGFLGTTVYYAKEAFVLLFMNAPQSSNVLTTSSSRPAKLGEPLGQAVKLLKEAAKDDDPDALFLLAEMNFHGNYTHPINYETAFDLYEQLAALDGNSTAQYMVGFLYATGLSVDRPADQAKSMLYHTFAAEQGNTRSEMTLAYRHYAGVATPRNCDEAVHWYRKVADKAIQYYRSGPPGGNSLVRESYRLADEHGGVYGEGASVSSAGMLAKQGGPTSDAYADVDDVLEYLHFQSSKGQLTSTYGLARLHYDGARGLPRDVKVAKEYFMTVARQYWASDGKIKSDVSPSTEKLASKAAGYLGRMFLRGEGMEQSFSKAKIWFLRGLANGDALCQYSLGIMYLRGYGVEVDVMRAADLLASAADQDLAVAQTNLGALFLDQGDVPTAIRYFEYAARNSHIEAFYYLAELNDQGIGRERSCNVAAAHYKIVAEKVEAIWGSLTDSYAAYEDGDNQKALIGYLMAAEQGSENAQANVAYLLDHTTPTWSPLTWLRSLSASATDKTAALLNDATLALTYWTRSSKQSNIDSQVKVGDYYLSGLGAPTSFENAASCYQAAAESMLSAQAMWNLGWMHENGIGIDQDFHLAKRFYDQALATNTEAYLPVQLSLWKLRWRSWWNGISGGSIHGIDDGPETELKEQKKKRSWSQWLDDFLEADAAQYHQEMEDAQYEPDDYDPMPGGDWDDADIDDDLIETLLIGGLLAALAWLVFYRRQQRRNAEERRQGEGEQQQPPVDGQQAAGGMFPPPGDPARAEWIAGGIGH